MAGLAVETSTGQAVSLVGGRQPAPIEFNQHVRPILSDSCFQCHGFDANKRKAGLRLDTVEGATNVVQGHQAIKPGDLAGSDLWRRINATQPDVRMPPPDSNKKLTVEQIALLGRWIEEGATYQRHWAFVPPSRPEPPPVKQTSWPRNELDRFILARLESEPLTPTAEAPKTTLLRRVSLDLTGLPPTPEEGDAFLADTSPEAYDRVVDRLLASPRFGEHFARFWLDAARYGDTHGLHLDNERSLWPYRDWVVNAFNHNLPFDQFTVEQLAGDLLPQPTREQLIASGFNRCNVSTAEGGAIDEEFRVRYAVDRVETTSAIWLGLTMGCAVCHDHKFDPFTQHEFYQVFSLFNNISENAMDGNALLPPPSLPLPSPDQARQAEQLKQGQTTLEKKLQEAVAAFRYTDPATLTNAPKPAPEEFVWIDDAFPAKIEARSNDKNLPFVWVAAKDGPVFSGARSLRRAGTGIHQTFFEGAGAPLVVGVGAKLFAYVYLAPTNPPKAVMLQFHVEGTWSKRGNWGDPDAIDYGKKGTTERVQVGPLPEPGCWARLEIAAEQLGLNPGTKINGWAFTAFDGTTWWDKAGQVSVNDPARDPSRSFLAWQSAEAKLGNESKVPDDLKALLKKDVAQRGTNEVQRLREHYLANVFDGNRATFGPIRDELKSTREQKAALEKAIPATLISKELEKPRPAWRLLRGQYDQHGEPVGPGVPSVLPPLPPAAVTNRLTFARWLVATNHPLTARVNVNRFWQQFFGTGLVKTAADFGSKGEWPSHPELLDWLATEFMRTGWDVKRLVRLIVSSATYRQDSRVAPALLAADPENRLLARGPRFRLDGEVLRDSALFVSGLLNPKMGGRGVRPYQPPGIWEAVGYTTSNTAKYEQDHGEALYRRSLYLFWKRTAPPPSMTTFDAPSREQCNVHRERTDTPLQALVLLNDPSYVEAARQFGYRMWHAGGASDEERLRYGFRWVTAREPESREREILEQTLHAQREHYGLHPDAAKQVIAVGESPVPTDVPATDLAAFTMVASLLFNLDEVITKN